MPCPICPDAVSNSLWVRGDGRSHRPASCLHCATFFPFFFIFSRPKEDRFQLAAGQTDRSGAYATPLLHYEGSPTRTRCQRATARRSDVCEGRGICLKVLESKRGRGGQKRENERGPSGYIWSTPAWGQKGERSERPNHCSENDLIGMIWHLETR
ncbi:hypothetical protein SRHO_G00275900 [Serrasalmus rhombeus]